MIQELKASYGRVFEEALIAEIAQVGTISANNDPMVGNEGDELLLYYLEQGDTCSMTMSCCMGQTKSEIRAIAETDAKLIMIPIRKMEEWTAKYRSWRNFVFESYNSRLNEMLQTIDSIAFLNMDERLVNYLKEKGFE